MTKGKFITIEGSEGAGKTTQLLNIKDYLIQQGIDVVTTREPGGTIISEKVRDILLDKENTELCTDAEMLLVFAARSQHMHELIEHTTYLTDTLTFCCFRHLEPIHRINTIRVSFQMFVILNLKGACTGVAFPH